METNRILRAFTLNVNDNLKLALEIEEMELASLEENGEEWQPGGSDLEVKVLGLGVKALSVKYKLKSHNPEIIGLFGGPPGIRQNFTGRKLIISEEDGSEHEHAVDINGRLAKLSPENMKGGKATGYDHEIQGIWNYTEYWDARPMHRFSYKKGGWDIWNFQTINAGRRRILF